MDSHDPADYLSFTADFADPTLVAVYDELPLWSALFGALLLRHVPLQRGATTLDLGCGTGFLPDDDTQVLVRKAAPHIQRARQRMSLRD